MENQTVEYEMSIVERRETVALVQEIIRMMTSLIGKMQTGKK